MVFEKFLDFFNFVILLFYWVRFELVKGKFDILRFKKAVEWFVSKGCIVKGYFFCWYIFIVLWLFEMNN